MRVSAPRDNSRGGGLGLATPSLIAPERCPQDSAEDVHSLDSCEYIWEAGVGFAHSPQPNYIHDVNR